MVKAGVAAATTLLLLAALVPGTASAAGRLSAADAPVWVCLLYTSDAADE